MTSGETNETYNTFADYCSYRKTLESYDDSSDNAVYFNEATVPQSIDKLDKNTFILCFKKIIKYFEKLPAENGYKESMFCAYINYWLNGISKNIYHTGNKSSVFLIFKNYIEQHTKAKNRATCKNKIQNLGNELYNKMKKLYDLYDHYESIFHYFHGGNSELSMLCEEYKSIIKIFNELMDKYNEKSDGPYLLEKLNDLKCLMKNESVLSKLTCKDELLQSFSVKLDSLPKGQQCNIKEQDLELVSKLMKKEPSSYQEMESTGSLLSFATPSSVNLLDSNSEESLHREGSAGRVPILEIPDRVSGYTGPVPIEKSPMNDPSVNKTSNYIINAALPLLGASSFTFLLYKVTPAGSFVNKFFGRNKSAYRNIDNIKKKCIK